MDIHIGNFDTKVTEKELTELFGAYGEIDSLRIQKSQHTGISRGFGYVSMPDEKEALQAIVGLHNFRLNNKPLTVSKAKHMSASRKMA
jgi:RNA recognition motif-containing protein